METTEIAPPQPVAPPVLQPPLSAVQPPSRTALFRVALDTLIGGLLAGTTVYGTTNQIKPAAVAGCIVALKTLQSRIAPDLAKMTEQRQAEKAGDQ